MRFSFLLAFVAHANGLRLMPRARPIVMSTVTLTPEQVKAFGEPAVRDLTPLAVGSSGTVALTPEQVKAFGEPAVRPLTAVAEAPEPATQTISLTPEQLKAFGEPAVRTLTPVEVPEPATPA